MKTHKSKVRTIPAFFTLKEAAGVAKCSVLTLQRQIKDGKLKAYQPTGFRGSVLIMQGNLLEWITSREKK